MKPTIHPLEGVAGGTCHDFNTKPLQKWLEGRLPPIHMGPDRGSQVPPKAPRPEARDDGGGGIRPAGRGSGPPGGVAAEAEGGESDHPPALDTPPPGEGRPWKTNIDNWRLFLARGYVRVYGVVFFFWY